MSTAAKNDEILCQKFEVGLENISESRMSSIPWKAERPVNTSLDTIKMRSIFPGQRLLAKFNHIFLYIVIFVITISGILKKLFNAEVLGLFFFNFEIKDNFELAEFFYDIQSRITF